VSDGVEYMRFKNNKELQLQKADKVGVLLVNLGTPKAPTTASVRKYLAEFLSDPRVIEIPRLIWLLILHGIVLRTRPSKSSKSYQTVWTERGSPLKFHTQDQAAALKSQLKKKWGEQVHVDFAMRYGEPSIKTKLQEMADQEVNKLLVLPLYPQYASATTGATFDAISADYTKRRTLPHLRFVADYHAHPNYIKVLADSIKEYWQDHGQAEKLILSFHGLPRYTHEKGDPYYNHCKKTTALLISALALEEHQYLMTFQSRLGRAEWLKPYTEPSLKKLAKHGVKFVQVVCPGFPADCLETIEEIGVENRDYFLEGGGERYEYIPSLNAQPAHIDMLSKLVEENIQSWVKTPTE